MRQEHLRSVFSKIARAAQVNARLIVVRHSYPNAWTDGQDVFISDSLMDSLPEGELAAVIGHELGHIASRHLLRTKEGLEDLHRRLHGDRNYQGLEGVMAAATIEVAVVVARQYRSRQDEFAADALGQALASKAGFGTGQMTQALERIATKHQTGNLLDSHPATPDRVARLRAARSGRIRILVKRSR